MLAISSDIDQTSIHALRAIHRFINTEDDTPAGPGVGLDFGNSMWMYGASSNKIRNTTVCYWNTPNETDRPTPMADELVNYVQTGWIDTLHTYGNFNTIPGARDFERSMAEKAIAELGKRNAHLQLWTNHGNVGNTQNIGAADYMAGDLPGSPSYHADLMTDFGIRFLCAPYRPNIPGQENILTPSTLKDGGKVYNWSQFTTVTDDFKVAARASSMDHRGGVTASGRYYAQVSQAGMLDAQLSSKVLDDIEGRGVFAIMAQHFGTLGPMSWPDPAAVSALRRLRRYQDAGRILVARTSRLLNYAANRKAAFWSVIGDDAGPVVDIVKLDDDVFGPRRPTLEALRGLTFEAPAHQTIRIAINGNLVDEQEIQRTEHGRYKTAGIKWHRHDTTDWSAEFRAKDRYTSVAGYPLIDEDRMTFADMDRKALEWLDGAGEEKYAAGDKDRQYAHKYARGRYAIGLEHYGSMMEHIGFTGRGIGLDVGSGAGHWVAAYAALNDRAVGLDTREVFVRIANDVAGAIGLGDVAHSVAGDARVLPFHSRSFASVWSHGVMMFVEHDRMFAEMNRVLAMNGALYVGYTALGHRLQHLSVEGEASARLRSSSLTIIFNTGLFKFGVYRTLRGRVRAFTREELQQTARYCGFRTLGAPGIQDASRLWGKVETTIDIIARKTSTPTDRAEDIAQEASSDSEIIAEAYRAMSFGAPEAAQSLIDVSGLKGSSSAANIAYVAAGLKAGRIDTLKHPDLAALEPNASDAAMRLSAKAAINFGKWADAIEALNKLPVDRETSYLKVATLMGQGKFQDAIRCAESQVESAPYDFLSRIAYLKSLEAADAAEALDRETEKFLEDIANDKIDVVAINGEDADSIPIFSPQYARPAGTAVQLDQTPSLGSPQS